MSYIQPLHINSSSKPQAEKVGVVYDVREARKSFEHTLSTYLAKVAKVLAVVGVTLIIFSFAPSFWYSVVGVEGNTRTLGEVFGFGKIMEDASGKENKVYQPKFDPTLPLESRLTLPSIGVDTQIHEATYENYEEALKKGVWRVSDFGAPTGQAKPMILAAHRFGYLKWSIPYRLRNSFFRLPKLAVGDTVEIAWRQRKYVYEIYGESEGEEITDYSADLVLYTCESLNSPVRIFKYARLLEI